ncbi:hypothetical protein GCWU000282_00110 [Catonella morbi ATCC 51271]|uniref:DivIVA domain protein n=1 Tax=Catonella morbi ATCC 51271 TaxID=592026 RepID=V2Y729_9FIRM|nr:DivIVA domain-containing protein [Catonella morbi]ESL04723.1 hypothetical protein GCWU000282_00110 [Catonella morbi ATCC 51271]
MLSLNEIRNHEFKWGIGYSKKSVDEFMLEIAGSYDEMYKETIELKDKMASLSEGLQYYKSIEKTLQKAMVLVQKASDEEREKAMNNAKLIEKEAHTRAEEVLTQAKYDLDSIFRQTDDLNRRFELYKAHIRNLITTQLELVDSDSYNITVNDLEGYLKLKQKLEDVKDIVHEKVEATKTGGTENEKAKFEEAKAEVIQPDIIKPDILKNDEVVVEELSENEAEIEKYIIEELKKSEADVGKNIIEELRKREVEAEKNKKEELRKKEAEAEKNKKEELKKKEAEAEKNRREELRRLELDFEQNKSEELRKSEVEIDQSIDEELNKIVAEAERNKNEEAKNEEVKNEEPKRSDIRFEKNRIDGLRKERVHNAKMNASSIKENLISRIPNENVNMGRAITRPFAEKGDMDNLNRKALVNRYRNSENERE